MSKAFLRIFFLALVQNALMAKIDNAIASSEINAERLEVIEFLRDKGETFHSLGDHEASEVTLNAAVDLL